MRFRRGTWVWNTAALFEDVPQASRLVQSASSIDITDSYLYINPKWWGTMAQDIANLTMKMHGAGLRTWALDGDVSYIDNETAHTRYLQSLEQLGQFNQEVMPTARFHGFQADIEFSDCRDTEQRFHNGVKPSKLTSQQQLSRDALLFKWVDVLGRSREIVRMAGLEFGAALPHWLHDYEGEPLTVPAEYGHRADVIELLMPLLDEYVVMSYSTHPATTKAEILEPVRHVSARHVRAEHRPRVLGALETATGVGEGISYGDTPQKRSRAAVLKDLVAVEGSMGYAKSFGGTAIHHWSARDALPP